MASVATLDKTSQAAVEWLTTANPDSFDHLVAICWKAKRNLFLRGETNESLAVSTRAWIRLFVLDYLASYQYATENEILQSAAEGAFKHLGRLCRLRIIDEIRRRVRANKERTQISLDEPVAVDDGGNELTLESLLSLSCEIEDGYLSALGQRRGLEKAELALVLFKHRIALEEALRTSGLETLKAVVDGFPDEASPIRAIVQRRQVGERQARRDLSALHQKLKEALRRNDPAISELHELLTWRQRGGIKRTVRKARMPPAA